LACIVAYYSVHYVMRVKCRNEAVQTSKYLKRVENCGHISLKSTMIAFWEFLGLYRCLIQRGLCHARKMQ
jgi:hypothetical protein